MSRASVTGPDDCDFLITNGRGTPVRVRLLADHRRGRPGGPVVLDDTGATFGYDGDQVIAGGGHVPESPHYLPDRISTFHAAELRVLE